MAQTFRNLDSDGDWTFGNGVANYIDKNAAIGLNIKTRILSWVNDCFFDLLAGIDWNSRLGNKGQRALLEADLRRIILQSDGVTGLVYLNTSLQGRIFTADYSVNTVYSQAYIGNLKREI